MTKASEAPPKKEDASMSSLLPSLFEKLLVDASVQRARDTVSSSPLLLVDGCAWKRFDNIQRQGLL